jgi:hypothetical protein
LWATGLLPVGQTKFIICDFSRLLVHQENIAMETWNYLCKIKLRSRRIITRQQRELGKCEFGIVPSLNSLPVWRQQLYPFLVLISQNTINLLLTAVINQRKIKLPCNSWTWMFFTYLCPLEAQNPHTQIEFHPGTPCCQEYFQPASDAIHETLGPCGLEHQDLAIQTAELSIY